MTLSLSVDSASGSGQHACICMYLVCMCIDRWQDSCLARLIYIYMETYAFVRDPRSGSGSTSQKCVC